MKVSVPYPDGSNARVANFIKIIGKEHFVFILQEDHISLEYWKMD